MGELVENNIIKFNEDTRKLVMKNGALIRRHPGESLVKATERIAGLDVPRVMLGFLGPMKDRRQAVQSFYQAEDCRARIEEVLSESDDLREDKQSTSDGEACSDKSEPAIFLTRPQKTI